MIKINKHQTRFFIRSKTGYFYPVEKGVYLYFDKSLEYKGIELFFKGDFRRYEKEADKMINDLISKDILEVY